MFRLGVGRMGIVMVPLSRWEEIHADLAKYYELWQQAERDKLEAEERERHALQRLGQLAPKGVAQG